MLADYLLKEARSRMYEKFDSLSRENQQRLINSPGMLRSEDQVTQGITRGNNALLNGMKLPVVQGNTFSTRVAISDKSSVRPTQLTVVDTSKYRNRVMLSGALGAETAQGRALSMQDVHRNIPWGVRHEIHEAQSMKARPKYDPTAGIIANAKGEMVGNHHSLGVLARDRKAMDGFSYLPSVQNQYHMRDSTGESSVMHAIGGQPYRSAKYNRRDLHRLDNASPAVSSFLGDHAKSIYNYPGTQDGAAWVGRALAKPPTRLDKAKALLGGLWKGLRR